MRLSPDEIKILYSRKKLMERIKLSDSNYFDFSIVIGNHEELVSAQFSDKGLVVNISQDKANDWISSGKIGIEQIIKSEEGKAISIIVEEDLPKRKKAADK